MGLFFIEGLGFCSQGIGIEIIRMNGFLIEIDIWSGTVFWFQFHKLITNTN